VADQTPSADAGTAAPGQQVRAEIAAQPAAWTSAAGLVGELAAMLPAGRIALAGCGSSYCAAQAVATLWERAGRGRADSFAASEMPARLDYDAVVVISRSGTTTEVLDLLHRLAGARTVALVGSPGPVSALASASVLLDFADDQSVVQTRFVTTVVALFRALLGEDVDALGAGLPEAIEGGQAGAEPGDVVRYVFLGTGPAVGLAHAAALVLREAALTVTESYAAMEYRHGPISLAEPGVVVWMLGEPPAGLAAEVRATGALVVDDDLDPLLDLARVQARAVALALAKGLDPDHPRHLTRSVQLT
jgi:fructoselysine-6-P-deglycase FrlB-like protein